MKTKEHNGIKYEVLRGWRSLIPFTNNRYRLLRDYRVFIGIEGFDIDTEFVRLEPSGHLTIRTGLESDGPSGPTIDSENFMRGAWIHDPLYWLLGELLLPAHYRFDADVILYLIILQDGMSRIRAMYVYQGVLRAAQGAALPKQMLVDPEIKETV